MLNLYKMHIYRSSKATSTLVIGILLGVFFFINSALAFFVFNDEILMSVAGITAESNYKASSVYPATLHTFHVSTSDAFNILITIFTVIFVNSDYSKGFIKNTYNLFEEKWKFTWAKWTSLITVVSGIFFVYSFLTLFSNAIILKHFSNSQWGDYFRVLLVTYICFVAFVTMTFLITSLFRSAAGGMVIGIIIASGLLQTVERLIDILIANLSGANAQDILMDVVGVNEANYFKISDYCLDNVYLSYNAEMSSGDTVRSILVALAYIGFGLGLAILVNRKRDLK
ncbi:MAG: hypothetical protein IKM88_10530 [Lachnospiraceae bacterium]|nr:hypothetical protein [Clostridiales bacterium]MBR6850660.1 hypothetical protein [Lachnospiraceae bacterium]